MKPRFALPALALLLAACGRPGEDASRVLANVGGTKITEGEFRTLVGALAKDPDQAKSFLNDEGARGERIGLLNQMASSRAMLQMAKAEGLDQDPRIQARLESAVAQVYYTALMERRAAKLEPTEADLKAFYEARTGEAKAKGQANIPPFEQVKAQLVAGWRQEQQQRMGLRMQQEIVAKVPMTFADDYQPGK